MKNLFESWSGKNPEPGGAPAAPRSAAPAESAPRPEAGGFIFEMADFLPRIPAGLLKEAAPAPKQAVEVEAADLASCLTDGRPGTTLAHLFRKTPGLFRPDAPPLDGVEIFYPWQKILQLVKQPGLGDGPSESVQHLLDQMKKCAEAKGAPVRGTARQVRNGQSELSGMSAQRETRRPAPGPQVRAAILGETTPAPEPEAAREIPIRVIPSAPPNVLRMPEPAPISHPAELTLQLVPDLARLSESTAAREREERLAALRAEHEAALAAQREEARSREEALVHERDRALAAAEAARAESVAAIEQARSAAALEHDRLRAELDAAKDDLSAAHAALAEREEQLQWKERALLELQAELDGFRERIKAVLRQRDDLLAEKNSLACALERRLAEAPGGAEPNA